MCAPDMAPEVVARFGVEPCLLITLSMKQTLSRSMKTLMDIGIAAAKHGTNPAVYLAGVRRIKPTWAVVPDKFADFRQTLALWLRYAPTISRYATPVFVVQEFHRPNILRILLDLRRLGIVGVALPMRRHPDVNCSLEPRLCAERAERALQALCGAVEHIHLLGPALRAVRLLRGALIQCERGGTVASFDTSAYRRAPNLLIKKQLGGRWQPRNREEAVAMLEAWLRQALA